MSDAAHVVFVVDDDRPFLTAIARLLRASGHTVETFTSAAALIERLARGGTGCVVADLRMPVMNGLDLQEALARSGLRLPVVFLSGHGDVPTTVRALKQGAEDFLTKRAPKEAILDAVARALARGDRERAEQARLSETRHKYERLTPREREVLAHVVQGRPNKQIAWDLSIHERTVKLHRTAITTKFGVASVAELTRMMVDAGFMPQLDSASKPALSR